MMIEDNAEKPRFPRHSPTLGRVEAEEILFGTLEQATERFSKGPPASKEAIYSALEVVRSFLGERGLSGQAIYLLTALRDDLRSMDEGHPSLYFGPKAPITKEDLEASRSRHRSKDMIRLYAAACVEALHRAGTPMREALSKVARATGKWPAVDTAPITANAIRKWRIAVKKLGPDDLRKRNYDMIVKSLTDGKRAGEFLKEILKDGPPLTGAPRK